MYHKLWVFLNSLLICTIIGYIWLFRPHDSTAIVLAQLFAQLAVLMFIINLNMYFIFLVIRKTPKRKVKIFLAKFSRRMMKWHIKIALTAVFVIIGHAFIMLNLFAARLGYSHPKFVSGYVPFFILIITLLSGYLRHNKASGYRRRFHLISAMIFAATFLFHVFY